MKDFKLCFSEHKSLSYQQQSISGDESSLWNFVFSLDTNKHVISKHRHPQKTQCLPKSWFLERSRAWNLVIPFEVMFRRFSFSSVLKKDPLILPIWRKNLIAKMHY